MKNFTIKKESFGANEETILENMSQKPSPPIVLSIAGSDSSGGAGIQADIKTISALGGYAATVITALTAQNTLGVSLLEPVSPKMVEQQAPAVFQDLHISAVKIGMVYHSSVSDTITDLLSYYHPQWVVCDPVMISTSGARLIQDETLERLEQNLFPISSLITPNLYEASMLTRQEITDTDDMRWAAKTLFDKYGCPILIKGGHLNSHAMCDILYDGTQWNAFSSSKISSPNLHGTGCTLSSAIATLLAFGQPLPLAIRLAKKYVTEAIIAASTMSIGKGNGPLWHFYQRR